MNTRTLLHFIPAIGGGGAEAMLGNLVESMDRTHWHQVVVTLAARPWPAAAARLHAAGVELVDLAAPAFLRRDVLARLWRQIRQHRPDVVQTWMHHADLIGGWCARLAGVTRIVWGIHCREIHRNPGDSDRKIAWFQKALGFSSRHLPRRIIACSAAAIDDHARLGYPRGRMTWVPNGIHTDRFVPDAAFGTATREALRIPEAVPVIGFVGRFHEMKDLPTFLKAAALLQKSVPEAHFILCGGAESELEEGARAALSLMPRREQTHFVPFGPEPERLYPAFCIFSLSSRTEACPMTVLEAMSCGVPCVTTDVGDCARLIGATGMVVPAGNAPALADAWGRALAARHDAARIRAHAVKHHDIRVAARAYAQVYEEVLA